MSNLDVIIMAAGKGTRMKSKKPKVLHTLGGMSMLQRLVNTVQMLNPHEIVVVTGFGAQQVQASIYGERLNYVLQEPQLGTGHAVQQALPLLPESEVTVILNGDAPLLQATTIQSLVDACAGSCLALLTVELETPKGYGRILRSPQGLVTGIVEEKDSTDCQRKIREVNTGLMAAPTADLKRWIANLSNDNAQQEYYLTDIVAMAVADGVEVVGVRTQDDVEVAGVNSPSQLAALERAYQTRVAHSFMELGVRLADPARLDVRGLLSCGQDVEIDVNCVFDGQVVLEDDVKIGANCIIKNAHIGKGAVIEPFTHIDGGVQEVQVGEGAVIGPYARLRPGTLLGRGVHIGNFVEVKNSTLSHGVKANHLSYLGDATVGENVNIGAGTITANYDGVNKYSCVVDANVRVGSNCVLVAPVAVGQGSTIGAGSVITKDVPENTLAVARARQSVIKEWKRPEKKYNPSK